MSIECARGSGNSHYSDKPGHRERSHFWRNLIKINGGDATTLPLKETIWQDRRKMKRMPQDGKK